MTFEPLWRSCPALLYGITVLLAFSLSYHFTPTLILPLLLLLLTLKNQKTRILLVSLLFCYSYLFASYCFKTPSIPQNGIFGVATLRIETLSLSQGKFQDSWLYKGALLNLKTPEKEYTFPSSPCFIKVPSKKNQRPSADYVYSLQGTLKETSKGRYSFSPKKNITWEPLKKTKTFTEWRLRTKGRIQKYIHKKIPNEQSAKFLAGISTGQFNDPYLSFEFGRFGLQHIMAISGFHFAILAFFLSMLFRPCFSYRITAALVMLFLTLYFFLLGFSPSVFRAWIMILIGLSSQLVERPTNSLNTFGFALMTTLFIDPHMIHNLGFQFSFAITAGILLLYSPINAFCKTLFGSHFPSKLSLADQHGYLILSFLRQGFALSLTVHFIAIPIVLQFFQKFPLLSMIYNLFFPLLVSFSMLFLILSFLTSPLPWISYFFDQVNNHFTEFLINLTYFMPLTTDFFLRSNPFSPDLVILYLTLLFFLGLWQANEKKEKQNFIFI